ncbi:VIT1/CCC1 transporter family protein [Lactiplantibacillus nangangensis]|uniref:VIT1/CCC1 transporter family protein n=1 Tax=Lactiplantibacillus nangangensis TaxID=2559917 RepID=A0ABW1SNM5_9LACO|nr:VIT1/CCC1 transporter family protein [Lactiplantibacillus nangangensis]
MLTTIKAWQDWYFHFWDRLNVLRAGILGANDGIISVSGIVLGAVGADLSNTTLFISGISGMLAGACSMAGGEYVSVSAQKDVQLSRWDHLIKIIQQWSK